MLNADRSAMPVMIPGSAIGRMMSSEIASRPKKRVRASAPATSEPRTTAIAVAHVAALSERRIACQTSSRSHATANHSTVRPGGGNW